MASRIKFMRRPLVEAILHSRHATPKDRSSALERLEIMSFQKREVNNMPRRISSLLHLSDAGNDDPALPTPGISKAGETNSAAQILLMRMGLMQQSDATGLYVILPLLQRSLEKITVIIDTLMQYSVNSQKITLPLLNPASWWNASGRDEIYGSELMSLQDRNRKRMILAPTHEEAVTKMLVNLFGQRSPYKKLPIRVHQITPKYRDEQRPRSGLLRGREFLMKDLYIFDADIGQARRSYEKVRRVYRHLFEKILFIDDLLECKGSAAKMGGILSHEFFMPAAHGVGEDTILWCEKGLKERNESGDAGYEYAINKELLDDTVDGNVREHRLCSNCVSTNKATGRCDVKSCEHVHTTKAVELGHAFIIGDKYSRIFNANYTAPKGQVRPLIMSCYGLGVTRILQAVLERSAAKHGALRWPPSIAPFQVAVIGPKSGSKEEKRGANKIMSETLRGCWSGMLPLDPLRSPADVLNLIHDIVIDDRAELSVGNRVRQMQKLGIPLIVVFGRASVPEDGSEAQVELMCADSNYQTKLVGVELVTSAVIRMLIESRNWKLPQVVSVTDQFEELPDEDESVNVSS